MKLKKQNLQNAGLVLAMGAAFACGKKKDDPVATPETAASPSASPEAPTPVKPGSVMLSLDGAMGSIAFGGQSASLALDGQSYDADWTTDPWKLAHCKPVGGATLENQSAPTRWGCLLAVKTDGPDTPRGGTARIVSVACSVDAAVAAGNAKVDGAEHKFKMPLDEACWGKDFAKMAAEYLPSAVNAATGFAEVDATVTGYTDIPASWTSVADKWDAAYDVVWSLGDGVTSRYQMLLAADDTTMAASILRKDSDKDDAEIFAMAIEQAADGTAKFRYEGRFPYGKHGDGSGYGSSHTRLIVSGPFKNGTFEKVTGGEGYEASMYGTGSTDTISNGAVKTFKANSDGIGTKEFHLTADGSVTGNAETAWGGTTGSSPDDYTYEGTAAEKAVVLTTLVAPWSSGAQWHKANGPLSYETAAISD